MKFGTEKDLSITEILEVEDFSTTALEEGTISHELFYKYVSNRGIIEENIDDMEDSYEELAMPKEANQIETIHRQEDIDDMEDSYEELAIPKEANQMETIHELNGPYEELEIFERID